MLEVVGQDIISGNMGFIGTDPDRLYRMGAAEKTEDVTVTGNPAVLDNATGKPFKDLHIYGRSEQVTTTGAQLLDLGALELRQETGATINRLDDGGFLINGTPKTAYEQYTRVFTLDLEPGTYYISGGKYSAGCAVVQINITNADDTKSYRTNRRFDVLGTEKEISIVLQSTSTDPIDNYKVYPMLNKGSAALPFEPYTGGKPSPSPDYPQEIVNAGEDGNLNVMVRGKNVFAGRFYYARYSNGILSIDKRRKDEEVKFPYKPELETAGICKALKCQKGKTYAISVTNPNKNATIGMAEYENIENVFSETNAVGFAKMDNNILKKSYTAKSDGILVCGIAGKWTNGSTTTHECTESELLQVEEASEATSYEPYHEPQSMSVTTPNGLPGIPVSSGGNYTDENGQQWICDEVDLGRGVRVQRVRIKALSPDLAWSYRKTDRGNNNFQVRIYNADVATIRNECLCNIMRYTGNGWDDIPQNLPKIYANDQEITISFLPNSEYSSLEVFKQLLTNVKSVIYYALATPIETPLTTSEIAAYKSLRTYRGTTIVEAEDKAGISVTYKRSAKTDNISKERKIEESEKKEYDES